MMFRPEAHSEGVSNILEMLLGRLGARKFSRKMNTDKENSIPSPPTDNCIR